MRTTRGVAAALLALTVLGGTGCATPVEVGASDWTASAEAWVSAYRDALDGGSGEHTLFYAVDVTDDATMLGGRFRATGRHAVSQLEGGPLATEVTAPTLFLGADSVVQVGSWATSGGDRLGTLTTLGIGPRGIQAVHRMVGAWATWGAGASLPQEMAGRTAEDLTEGYLAAWRSGSESGLRDVYAPDATVVDALTGSVRRGLDAIAGLSAERSTERLAPLDRIWPSAPSGWAGQVFTRLTPTRYGELTEIGLLLAGAGPCRGRTAALLALDAQGRVATETRYPAAEDLAGCSAGEPEGWWTGRGLPVPLGERVTGRLATAAGSVEIRGGSAQAELLVAWALDRFDAAGLPAPQVTSVTFDPLDTRCEGCTGQTLQADGATTILVCLDASQVAAPRPPGAGCVPGAPSPGHLLLHELGHAWVATWLDAESQARVTAVAGAESWSDAGTPWARRGTEWAAEALAWGLDPEGHRSSWTCQVPCAVLAQVFVELTGTPAPRACPAGG